MSNDTASQFWDVVEYLKGPELVIAFQNYFGIYRIDSDERTRLFGSKTRKTTKSRCPTTTNSASSLSVSSSSENLDGSLGNHFTPLNSQSSECLIANKDRNGNKELVTKLNGFVKQEENRVSNCHLTTDGSVLTHRRELSQLSQCSSIGSDTNSELDSGVNSGEDLKENIDYVVNNKIWYYLFSLGASLGYEVFYATFFPIW